MYFQKLENLSHLKSYKSFNPMIEALDTWFAYLPRSYRDKISPESFANKEEVPLKIVYKIFDELIEVDMIKERYIIRCAEENCGHVNYIANNLKDLEHFINEYNYNYEECNFCEKTCKISSDYIFVIYELLDKPREGVVKKNILVDLELSSVKSSNLTDRIKQNPKIYKDGLEEDTLKSIVSSEMYAFVLEDQ